MPATKVVVNLPDAASYDVRIGSGILDSLGERILRSVPGAAVAVLITDSHVGPLYAEQVHDNLKKAALRVVDITIPAGESAKSLACATEVWEALVAQNVGEDALVVALGGTTVCDLAGFVAAAYNGGIPLVLVPTSLLSMATSSASGVAHVDVQGEADALSLRIYPRYVCANLDLLETLPEDVWERSCVDLEQFACLCSDDYAAWLAEHADEVAARDHDTVMEALVHSVVFCADNLAEGPIG